MKNQPTEPARTPSLDLESLRSRYKSILCAYGYRGASNSKRSSARFDAVQLGDVSVLRHFAKGLKGTSRTFRQVREDKTDDFIFSVPLSTAVSVSQAGHVAIAKPGTCFMVTTSKLCEVSYDIQPGNTYAELIVQIPGPLLRRRLPHIDACCARPISITHGAGKIMRALIEDMLDEKDHYSENQATRFGDVLIDVAANTLLDAPELADVQQPQHQLAHERIFERAKTFIESNLSHPGLDVATIAKHCDISTGYLHAAFAACSQSVGAFIRQLRLDRCQEALLNPSLQQTSIIEIAMQWGFSSSSTFNHVYRERFGKSPSEMRKRLAASV